MPDIEFLDLRDCRDGTNSVEGDAMTGMHFQADLNAISRRIDNTGQKTLGLGFMPRYQGIAIGPDMDFDRGVLMDRTPPVAPDPAR